MSSQRVQGAVLTGGMSRRMGQDKTDVLVRDRTMLDMVGSALSTVTDDVVLLGPERDGWVSWPDTVHVGGPLAGIAGALARSEASHLLVVAVDHPFVRPETLRGILTRISVVPVVPVDHHGIRQVTCAVYPTAIAAEAREEADNDGSIQSLLDRVSFAPLTPDDWEAWGEDGRSWFSVDSEARLEEALAIFQLDD